MRKISSVTDTADANGEFTEGNVAQGVSPTILKADIFNTWQRELVNVVEKAGIELDPNDDGQVFKAINKSVGSGRLLNIKTFKSSGAYMPSLGTNFIVVEAIGGGGAGGGAAATGTGAVSVGSGGTAGSYGKSIFTTGFSGAVVTVGARGVPIAGESGGAGGASSFGTLLIAAGGSGGIRKGPSEPTFGVTGSSAGGTVTGANIISASGAPGGYSMAISLLGTVGGIGAASIYGGGGTLNIAAENGVEGSAPGSGGSGAFQGENQAIARSGGAGAAGVVIVWEYA
ncbi:phage tail protein [Serratia fonticola]|uniref:phage tail protein n=1 Tax=Serratia fonticola TaxID=47917 RepID=UPI0013772397|nr:phage tail protein [Serratia fonticola]NCG50175.1 phage tail protein [Serratia fonticola]